MIIYKTINLINNKIYIGQHNGNRKSSYLGSGKLLKAAFLKYGKENFTKEIIIEGNYNQCLIDELEKHYIHLFASNNKEIGYNIQKGGFGIKPRNISDEFKENCRKRMIGNKIMLGRKRSLESREKQSKTQINKINSLSSKERREIALKAVKTRNELYDIGKLISKSKQENKKLNWENNQSKRVLQIDKEGNPIKLWASSYQAYKEKGYSHTHIRSVCLNLKGHVTHKNFKWKYVNSDEIEKYSNLK